MQASEGTSGTCLMPSKAIIARIDVQKRVYEAFGFKLNRITAVESNGGMRTIKS